MNTNDNNSDVINDESEYALPEGWSRHDWLDQFRGICVLLYIVPVLTWGFSGAVYGIVLDVPR